jgi:hydroxymethylpyrimidine pyrophosphatase-like HAD family hydrolase
MTQIIRVCRVCKQQFQFEMSRNNNRRAFCSSLCKRNYRREYEKTWNRSNPDRLRAYTKKHFANRRFIWKKNIYAKKDVYEIQLIAIKKLADHGFSDILDLSTVNKLFTGDCIATKDGKDCLIEITSAYSHEIYGHKKLCRRLGLDLYAIFVNHDRTEIIVKKVDVDSETRNVCLSVRNLVTGN